MSGAKEGAETTQEISVVTSTLAEVEREHIVQVLRETNGEASHRSSRGGVRDNATPDNWCSPGRNLGV